MARLHRTTLEQEQGYGWAEGVHPEDYKRCLQVYVDSFECARTSRWNTACGEATANILGLDSGVPRFDPHGLFQGYMGSCVDITTSKRAELEIQQHRSELAHLSRVTTMGELSGSMAHELNQPLAAILCYAQAALRFLALDTVNLEDLREILKDIANGKESVRPGYEGRIAPALQKKGKFSFNPSN